MFNNLVTSCFTAHWTSLPSRPRALPAWLRSNIKPALTEQPSSYILHPAQWLHHLDNLTGGINQRLRIFFFPHNFCKHSDCPSTTVHQNTGICVMELPVSCDSVHLAAYKHRPPASVADARATPGRVDEAGYYQCYGDESSVASRRSEALTGYDTLDSPPHYDFYANTEVWGRRRRFRPSLYQLYAMPEVGICCFFFCLVFCIPFKSPVWCKI